MKRIIVKIGTKVLTDKYGVLSELALRNVVEQIVGLKNAGHEVVLVSSGAMGAGKSVLKTDKELSGVSEKQFFAAIGQAHLMKIYGQMLSEHSLACAQILATKEDFRDKMHFFNMRNCLEVLLHDNVVPIVNENDAVATGELTFTDNDELAGQVASMLNADSLIILTSVDGLIDFESGKTIGTVDQGDYARLESYITPDISNAGRGGMISKFAIAKRLAAQGIEVFFINGIKPYSLDEILNGEHTGTYFLPGKRLSSAKRRLAHADAEVQGAVYVNECAVDVLQEKEATSSLLFVGITKIEGDFKKGDILKIISPDEEVLGYGVSKYDKKEVKDQLGKKGAKPLIHYDYMFIE